MIHRRLRITGRVQGVSYRAWFARQAMLLGLDGWVRNRTDGSVEAIVQGPADAVERITAQAHEGPPAARVRTVAIADDPTSQEDLRGFETRATA